MTEDAAEGEGIVFDQKIDLPFRYTVSAAQRAFLRGLTRGELVASSDGTRSYLPARPFAPDGTRLEWVTRLEPRGTVIASTTAEHLGGRVYALVAIDGSETPLFHLLDEELPAGTRVEAVWAEDAEPDILALACFRKCAAP